MHKYKLTVPVTQYYEVSLSTKNLIELLEQEEKRLCGSWDTITESKGKYYYYDRGYGSHNIGRCTGEEVDSETLEIYQSIESVINYLRGRD